MTETRALSERDLGFAAQGRPSYTAGTISRVATAGLSRRSFLGTVAVGAAGAAMLAARDAQAAGPSLAAKAPAGFVPLAIPGKIVKVSKANTLQPNGLWPTETAAKLM